MSIVLSMCADIHTTYCINWRASEASETLRSVKSRLAIYMHYSTYIIIFAL